MSEEEKYDNYRFEKKFFIPEQLTHSIEEIIKLNSSLARKIFTPRFINNIYFDNSKFQYFFENIDGVSERIKVRIRWYGDFEGRINEPFLEFKKKVGSVGSKKKFRLPSFNLSDIYLPNFLSFLFRRSKLGIFEKNLMLGLKPTLINRYQRKYFLSFDKKFRITLDKHLEYFLINSSQSIFSRGLKDELRMIMELKYAPKHQFESAIITQELPFRVIKNSKYVRGVQTLYNLGNHI